MTAAAQLRLVLFDLDGTLADSAPDLAAAVNRCRTDRGMPPLPVEDLRPWASYGARGLIQHGFGFGPGDERYAPIRDDFMRYYAQDICRHTRLFPGVEQTLQAIEAAGLLWGVVTNKYARLTAPLLESLGIGHRAACVVSGDTTPRAKPDPAPILHALAETRCAANASIYVGDDLRDVQAGRAAGVGTVVAAYGYSASIEDVTQWHADHVIDQPQDLLAWIFPAPPA
jgi:phosphoglycolate phosphatase